jgi:uncharacterized protein Yka (UPF0111/DUF47 family)
MRSFEDQIDQIKSHVTSVQRENKDWLRDEFHKNAERQVKIHDKVSSANENSKWSILITSVLPFLAPWMREKIKEASENKDNSPVDVLDKALAMVEPIKDEMPEDIQEKFTQVEILKKTLENYGNDQD